MVQKLSTCVIESHNDTWHDGGVAVWHPRGNIIALASERVGDRFKHSWNSFLAYEYLRSRIGDDCFGSVYDNFVNSRSKGQLQQSQHHLMHAASAFFPSAFEESAVLIVDGQGPEQLENHSTTIWAGSRANGLSFVESYYPTRSAFVAQSLGHFYTAIGVLAGMQSLHEEGKTMGLAAYGKPSRFLDVFRKYVYTRQDGSYFVNPQFVVGILGNTLGPRLFGWHRRRVSKNAQHIWNEILALRTRPLREKDEDVTQDDKDIAYAGQKILEEVVLGLTRRARQLTGLKNLCFGGGVALNCVVNGQLLQSKVFERIYIPPTPGDDGQALGKLYLNLWKNEIIVRADKMPFLGPAYSLKEIRWAIQREAYSHLEVLTDNMYATLERVVEMLKAGKVVAWFQGRSEVGPRALGHRSLLADPRVPTMRDYLNFCVKGREWYRPVAPVVLEDHAQEYFDCSCSIPFMNMTVPVRNAAKHLIPSAVHIDGTARLQTVSAHQQPLFAKLLRLFAERTGIPVLLNTSFNGPGEPIVETPEDALQSFKKLSGIHALVLGPYLVTRREEVNR